MADRNGSLTDEHESAKPAQDAKKGISTLEPNEARQNTGRSSTCSEMTDNETAEEKSWGAIQDGLQPKAGPRLYFGGQKARKDDREMPVQLQRDTNISAYQTATDRVGANVQEQEASRIASYGTINLGAGELGRIQGLTDPLLDNPLRYHFAQVQEQQKLLDAVLGGSAARALREQWEVLEQQRRYLTPQAQYNFVRQLTQPPEDRVRRATTLHEPEILTLIRKQVDSATFLRITDRSAVLDQRWGHADITASAPTFVRDTTAIACEGWSLFRTLGLTHDNVNLLDDNAPPATLPAGFDGDGPIPVERNQAESELLRQLEIDFGRYGNPVYAYEALAVALRSGIYIPPWVQRHMLQGAECILGIRDAIAGGRPSKREAERVGKVLGFGKDGPGQGGSFKQAAMLQRDRTIFVEVEKRLEAGMKLDFAYDEVAKMLGVSRSTIVRSYQKIAKMVRE